MLAAQPRLFLDVPAFQRVNAGHDVSMQHMNAASSDVPVHSYEVMPAAPAQPPVATGNEPLEQLLPRMTKVLIRGNNRTKSSLVGQHGTVKRSNGLGGWHLVVLETGEEVRLQRNALTVLSVPTASDREDFTDEEEAEAQHELTDALPRARRRRPSRPVSAPEFTLAERRTSQRQAAQAPRINFHRLDSTALRRYRRFYQLQDVGPNSTKEQLVSAVGRHFSQQTVDEDYVIASFVKAVRNQAGQAPGGSELEDDNDGAHEYDHEDVY